MNLLHQLHSQCDVNRLLPTIQLFLATNSPFDFVNAGMEFLLQGHLPNGVKHWTEMFDLVMTSCRKPSFFLHNRPFRCVGTFLLLPLIGLA